MLYPVELRGRKRAQSSDSPYPLIYRRLPPFVKGLLLSARVLPASQPHAAQSIKAVEPPAPTPSPSKGMALSSGRTMDMLEVVGFGFMSLVWVAFVVVTARPRTV